MLKNILKQSIKIKSGNIIQIDTRLELENIKMNIKISKKFGRIVPVWFKNLIPCDFIGAIIIMHLASLKLYFTLVKL